MLLISFLERGETFLRLKADTTCGKPLISSVERGAMHCKDLFLLIFGGGSVVMVQKAWKSEAIMMIAVRIVQFGTGG